MFRLLFLFNISCAGSQEPRLSESSSAALQRDLVFSHFSSMILLFSISVF